MLALLAVRASCAPRPSLDQVEKLISFNKIWDAHQQLTTLLADSTDPHLLLLRADCAAKMELPREALRDCTSVVGWPNATAAQIRAALRLRAACHLQLGDFDSAESDATASRDLKVGRQLSEARKLLAAADSELAASDVSSAKKSLDRLIRLTPRAPAILRRRAEIAWNEADHARYFQVIQGIADDFPADAELNYRLGIVFLCRDEFDSAKKHLERAGTENATAALGAMAAVAESRGRALAAIASNAFPTARNALNLTLSSTQLFCPARTVLHTNVDSLLATVLRRTGDKRALVDALTRLIDAQENISLYWERGRLHMALGDFDAAIYDFTYIESRQPGNATVRGAYERAAAAKKAATRADLYAVLEVRNNATPDEIQAAYKRAVRKHHPDRFQAEEDKRRAEDAMKVLNTAYDVLSNPDRRAIYDAGGDLNDIDLVEYVRAHPHEMPMGFPDFPYDSPL
jgi:tetratricopeptide (TPR) repeat protein